MTQTASDPFPYRAAFKLDQGRQRENNEDEILFLEERGIFAVIDGVGGHRAGEEAARIAKEKLKNTLTRNILAEPSERLRQAIALTNNAIFEAAQKDPALEGMACVLTVVVIENGVVTAGHVGDTRLYKLHGNQIQRITRDHSPVGEQEAAQLISEEEAMRHPRRNEIFRDVGTESRHPNDDEFIDIYNETFEPDAALLLCSDGLSDLVTSKEILEIVRRDAGHPEKAVINLVDEANTKGGKDNISIVLVESLQFGNSSLPKVPQTLPTNAGSSSVEPNNQGSYPMQVSEPKSFWSRNVSSKKTTNDIEEDPQLTDAETMELESVARGTHPGRWLFGAVLGVGLLLVLFFQFGPGWSMVRDLWPAAERPPGNTRESQTLLVHADGTEDYATIQEALEAAQPGDVISVVKGVYAERVELKSGVTLRSIEPRGAVLCLQPTAPGDDERGIAFRAVNVQDAHLIGFRIDGEPSCSLEFGLVFESSEVLVEGVEISGASEAAILISGQDQSTFKLNYLHDNQRDGIRVTDEAAPRLHDNLITNSGRDGIRVESDAIPTIANNTLRQNRTGIATPTEERRDEFLQWNHFGNTPEANRLRVMISEPGG